MCDSREKGVGDKGSIHSGRVNSWYARNAMIFEPCVVEKSIA